MAHVEAGATDDATSDIRLFTRAYHEAWALQALHVLGVGNDPRYTPTTTFETFPFPEGLTPNIPPRSTPTIRAPSASPIRRGG